MPLNIKTKTVHTIYGHNLDAFIQETYGVGYSTAAANEAADDQTFEFSVVGEVDEWEQQDVDSILAGGWENFSTGAMLNYMAKSGLIPTGDYLVTCVS